MKWLARWSCKNLLKLSVCIFSFGTCLFASPLPLSQQISDKDEAFLVRRIAEFWKDQEYKIVKDQIAEFLVSYPKSSINDHLRGIWGDLLLQDSDYEGALGVYQKIRSKAIVAKVLINKLQCYYEMDEYGAMVREGSNYLTNVPEDFEQRTDEFHFLMGEAYFRTAATMDESNKRMEMLAMAEPLYEKVIQSSFNDPTMFALAEIYRLRNENEKAAEYFLELAKRHTDQKEELKFHAALAQAEFDKAAAIETFTNIVDLGGIKSQEAALNRLILFFQEGQYENVLSYYKDVIGTLEQKKQPMLQYIVGRSYFATEDYKHSSQWLGEYAERVQDASSELRNALLMQLNCAQNLHDEDLYDNTISLLEQTFPKDSELPQAQFIHAMMLKEQESFDAAEEKLAKIIKQYPKFEDFETLHLEYSLVSYSNEKWEKSHKLLKTFISEHPKSEHIDIAWKYLLSSSLNLLKSGDSNSINYSKGDFLKDLTSVLKRDEILTPNEKKECLFLQGKLAYELAHYDDSLNCLDNYLSAYPQDTSAAEAHLLVALCHHKLNGNPKAFCEHAEAALKANPDLESKSSIHLELYNVYLSMIEKSAKNDNYSGLQERMLFGNAAEHLFTAMKLQELPIKLENRLWLANYFYDQAVVTPELYENDGGIPNAANTVAFERTSTLFENLICNEGHQLVTLNEKQTFLEWETLKMANIFGRKGQSNEKIGLLKSLIEQQTRHPKWKWKLQKEAMLELAKSYDSAQMKDDALETYDFIATHYGAEPSFASEYAYLHSLKLQFETMPHSLKIEDNAQVFKILSDLKELQIRKNVASEPIHLEAACEYAWIRAQISPLEDQTSKYQFFLNRIQEDFQNTDDPMVTMYQGELSNDEMKRGLYGQFMQFVEAEIARCEAITAYQENHTAQGLQASDKAKELLTGILETSTSFYLVARVKTSLNALEHSRVS